jgi:hypothetical protein
MASVSRIADRMTFPPKLPALSPDLSRDVGKIEVFPAFAMATLR